MHREFNITFSEEFQFQVYKGISVSGLPRNFSFRLAKEFLDVIKQRSFSFSLPKRVSFLQRNSCFNFATEFQFQFCNNLKQFIFSFAKKIKVVSVFEYVFYIQNLIATIGTKYCVKFKIHGFKNDGGQMARLDIHGGSRLDLATLVSCRKLSILERKIIV